MKLCCWISWSTLFAAVPSPWSLQCNTTGLSNLAAGCRWFIKASSWFAWFFSLHWTMDWQILSCLIHSQLGVSSIPVAPTATHMGYCTNWCRFRHILDETSDTVIWRWIPKVSLILEFQLTSSLQHCHEDGYV